MNPAAATAGLASTTRWLSMGTILPFPGPGRRMPTAVENHAASHPANAGGPERAGDGSQQWAGWMTRAQAGDRIAYQSLLIAIAPYLRAIARRHLRQDQDAEDMVQEILILVHDIRHTYEPGRPFKPWLGTIATRRCIDALRQRTRRAQREQLLDESHEHVADEGATPERLLSEAQSRHAVHRALDALPSRQREAVQLLRIEELSLREAAERSQQSVGSLKVACHRAIKALQRKLVGQDVHAEEQDDV
jgi:RNA polymerase sigma-70 factor (ECF subfamily)